MRRQITPLITTGHTQLEKVLGELGQKEIIAIEAPIREINNADTCPSELLPWLAWRNSVDFWKDEWTDQTKRNVIKASPFVHKKKGTLQAVRDAIAATGITAKVFVDKNNPLYVPHSFIVDVSPDDVIPDNKNIADLSFQIKNTKPARCAHTIRFSNLLPIASGVKIGFTTVIRDGSELNYSYARSVFSEMLSAAPAVATSYVVRDGNELNYSYARSVFSKMFSAAPAVATSYVVRDGSELNYSYARSVFSEMFSAAPAVATSYVVRDGNELNYGY